MPTVFVNLVILAVIHQAGTGLECLSLGIELEESDGVIDGPQSPQKQLSSLFLNVRNGWDDAQGADEWVAPALQALGTSIYTLWPRLNGFDVGVPLHRMGIWDGLAEKAWQTERRHMCRRKGRKHTVRQ